VARQNYHSASRRLPRQPHDGAETFDSTWSEICDCSCRWKNGFIKDAKLVFLAKRNSADYHDEMDSKRFEKWFQDQLLPNSRPGSVIVMDNAAYQLGLNYCPLLHGGRKILNSGC
jgi:hypothetical protein